MSAARCLALCALLAAGAARAASSDTVQEELARPAEQSQPEADKDKVGFVILPVPRADPTLGAGITLTALMMYRAEGSTRPWISGAAAMYTDNDSKAAGVFQKAYLMNDRLRLTGVVGAFDLNLKFYGIGAAAGNTGTSIPINQEGTAVYAKGLYEVGPSIFAGPIVRYATITTSLQSPLLPQVGIPQQQLDVVTSGLGLALEYDTRDSELDPQRGTFVSVDAVYPREDLGSDFNYGFLHIAVNHYLPLGQRTILALRAFTCSATGNVPFFDLCLFGMHDDLRGYVGGQYRDRAMYATQGELRWNFHARWGAVAFAGVGAVAPSWSEFSGATLLPSYGAGLRFLASKVHKVNISLDWARGRDDDAIYVRIGEAF